MSDVTASSPHAGPQPARPVPHLAVVGAGHGMGLAVARRFAREGWAVSLLARGADRLQGEAATLVREHGAALAGAVAADAGDEASLRAGLRQAVAERGPVEALVVNQSVFVDGALDAVDVGALRRALEVGATSFVVALQEVAPAMRAAGHGTVLATGGGVVFAPHAGWGVLGAQKAALRALVQAAALELAPAGVHVGTVTISGMVGSPGFEADVIAEHYWRLHRQGASPDRPGWETEVVHGG
ncbi:MAG: SDR family oxidoreductase [Motilibacteraceae bacterium]